MTSFVSVSHLMMAPFASTRRTPVYGPRNLESVTKISQDFTMTQSYRNVCPLTTQVRPCLWFHCHLAIKNNKKKCLYKLHGSCSEKRGLMLLYSKRSVYFMDQMVVRHNRYRGYLFFSVKDRNLFHWVDTIGNIFTSGAATSENITDGVHEMK